jgi:hypothetical protein
MLVAEKTILRMACAATLLLAAFASGTVRSQQKMDNYNRDRARAILHDAYDNVSTTMIRNFTAWILTRASSSSIKGSSTPLL